MTDEEEITEKRLIGHKLAGTEGWKCVNVAGDNVYIVQANQIN